MLNRRHFVSAGAMALALTASVAHADDWKSKYKELTFAVIPAENASGVSDRYAPFMEYLSKELGVPVSAIDRGEERHPFAITTQAEHLGAEGSPLGAQRSLDQRHGGLVGRAAAFAPVAAMAGADDVLPGGHPIA